ncbi:MAG: response regulator [Deltaproteobacteria bacterium]|nr:MAG: response regulator [Deltaproteobacteria bacterium]
MAQPDLLVVEPDTSARGLILRAGRASGLEVVTARTAYDALACLDECRPRVVVSEAALPDVDGLTLLERLRTRSETRETPVFFLAHEAQVDFARARAAGVDDVLAKPLFLQDLVSLGRLFAGQRSGQPVVEGRLEPGGLARLLRALLAGRRSGRIVVGEGQGELAFHSGRVVSAHRSGAPCESQARSDGEEGLYRLLATAEGTARVIFSEGESGPLSIGVTDLVARAFPWVRRYEQVVASLYPLDTRLVVDFHRLAGVLHQIPDSVNAVIRRFDGRRTLAEVVDGAPFPYLRALEVVAKLDAMGLLVPLWPEAGAGEVAEAEEARAEGAWGASAEEEGLDLGAVETPVADEVLQAFFGPGAPPVLAPAQLPAAPEDWYRAYRKGEDSWERVTGEATGAAAGRTSEVEVRGYDRIEHALRYGVLEGYHPAAVPEETAPAAEETEGAARDRVVEAFGARPAGRSSDAEATPSDAASAPATSSGPARGAEAPGLPDAAPSHRQAGDATASEVTEAPRVFGAVFELEEEAFFSSPPQQVAPEPDGEVDGGRRGSPAWVAAVAAAAVAALFFLWVFTRPVAPRAELGVEPTRARTAEAPRRAIQVAEQEAMAPGASAAGEAAGAPVAAPESGTGPAEAAGTGAGALEPKVASETAPTAEPALAPEALPAVDPVAERLEDGRAAYAAGAYEAAVEAYREALRLEPENVSAHLGLGLALLDGGHAREAVRVLAEARRLKPQDPQAVLLHGTALQMAGDREGARAAYRAYLRLAPKGRHAREVRALLSQL